MIRSRILDLAQSGNKHHAKCGEGTHIYIFFWILGQEIKTHSKIHICTFWTDWFSKEKVLNKFRWRDEKTVTLEWRGGRRRTDPTRGRNTNLVSRDAAFFLQAYTLEYKCIREFFCVRWMVEKKWTIEPSMPDAWRVVLPSNEKRTLMHTNFWMKSRMGRSCATSPLNASNIDGSSFWSSSKHSYKVHKKHK